MLSSGNRSFVTTPDTADPLYSIKKMKELFDIEMLKKLYYEKFSNSNSKGVDKISGINFGKKLDEELSLINNRIANEDYKFSLYLEKLIIKNRFKKPRILSVPTIRDRITLNQIKEFLHTKIPSAVFRTIAQQCIREIKQELEIGKYNYFIRTDLSNFYDRIERERLISILSNYDIEPVDLNLIEQSISNITVPKNYSNKEKKKFFREKGVPQGLSISNFLAQVYLIEFDSLMKDEDCFIMRYVDDILILCKEDNAVHIEEYMTSYLKGINLELNEDKTYKGKLELAFEFLGYRFQHGKISIAEKNVQKRINSIAGKFTWFTKGWIDKKLRVPYLINNDEKYKIRFIDQLNNLIAGVIIENKKRSFVDYYREINDLKILYRLDNIVDRLFSQNAAFGSTPKSVKRFVKSYFELKHKKETKYLTNLDVIYDIKDKRIFLLENGYINKFKKYEDNEILLIFKKYINRQIRENKKLSYTSS